MENPARPGALPAEPRRILLVRLGAIGDCLRVEPCLRRLREAFPGSEIGWAVEDLAAPLLAGHPDLARLHVVRRAALKAGPLSFLREIGRAGRELAAARYDVAIDFHTRFKSGLLTRASRAPLRIGVDRRSGTEANFLFTNCHVSLQDQYENRVVRFLRLLAPLGVDAGAPGPPPGIWVAPEAIEKAGRLYEESGRPDVAVFAGTSARRRDDRWPEWSWQDLVAELGRRGLTSMVLWGPGDHDSARRIAAGSESAVVAPATSLVEMAALLGRFRLYVGSNTAALHMAWMQGVPSVVVLGGRPARTDRPLDPVPSVMLTAAGVRADRKLHGQEARRAVEGIGVGEVADAALTLVRPSRLP